MKKPLSAFIREYSARNKNEACSAVYSVTNSHGFMPSTEYFSKEVFSKDLSTYKIVKKGMIAYNPSRINVGSVAVQRTAEQVIVSPLYVVFEVNEKELLPEYVSYFLHSDIGLAQIAMNTLGSVRDSLKFNALQKIEINVYSVEEQRRVVDKLQRLEAISLKKRKVLEKFEDLVKSQFIEMFGDVVRNEKGWHCETIDDVAPIEPYKGKIDTRNGKIWLLNLDMVEAQTGEIISKVEVAEEEIGSSTTTFCEDNVLYSKLRPYLNKVVVPMEKGYATSELVPLKPNSKKLHRLYFATALRSDAFVGFIQEQVAGAKMPRVSMGVFRNFRMPCPPITLQNQFAAFVEQTDKSKFRIKQSLEKLEKCYKALLQKYFG